MLKVAIVDDDKTVCDQIHRILLEYDFRYEVDFEIDEYVSCEELYSNLKRAEFYNLIFLDIEFPDMNGIELSRKVRQVLRDLRTQIIFVSAKQTYAMNLFSVQPFDFIIKPINRNKIFESVTRFIDYHIETNKFFTYTFKNIKHKIAVNLIIYIRSEGKKLLLHTLDEDILIYQKFSDAIKSELKNQFVVVRRGVAVNVNHILMSDFNSITLSDKTVFYISRRQQNEVRERMSYIVGGK